MRRLLIAVSTAVVMSGALFAGATPASAVGPAASSSTAGAETVGTAAVTCLGGAVGFTKPAGTVQVPRGAGAFFRTSNRCADINLRPDRTVGARVCFEATGCQRVYTSVLGGQWAVIATNVRDDVPFRIDFSSSADLSGQYAA